MPYGNYKSNRSDADRSPGGRSYGGDRYNSDRSRFSSTRPSALLNPVLEVMPPKAPVDPSTNDLMRFKDNYYGVESLRAQSSSGPQIEITTDELHDNFIAIVVPSRELPAEVLDFSPVFAKYEGKYVVLLGLKAVMTQVQNAPEGATVKLKGRLLSNPTLKRCLA